jgi:hypothetical protein
MFPPTGDQLSTWRRKVPAAIEGTSERLSPRSHNSLSLKEYNCRASRLKRRRTAQAVLMR